MNAQRVLTTSEITAIHDAAAGAEGDLYMNSDDGILWIGLWSFIPS